MSKWWAFGSFQPSPEQISRPTVSILVVFSYHVIETVAVTLNFIWIQPKMSPFIDNWPTEVHQRCLAVQLRCLGVNVWYYSRHWCYTRCTFHKYTTIESFAYFPTLFAYRSSSAFDLHKLLKWFFFQKKRRWLLFLLADRFRFCFLSLTRLNCLVSASMKESASWPFRLHITTVRRNLNWLMT